MYASGKSKVAAMRTIGAKGKVRLIVNYETEKENRKTVITYADAGVTEQDIPDNYNVYTNSVDCTVSEDKKIARARAVGMIERAVVMKDRLRILKKKLDMKGYVRV